MSLNKSNKSACIPANIYCEYTHDRYQDEGLRLLEKYLPYLNPETGLRNRMITRDPVTGLGDLEAEWNPLNGCHLRRRHFPHRDPIRMEGDMGTEYNCLYTTKELTCKDRVNTTDTNYSNGYFYVDHLNNKNENKHSDDNYNSNNNNTHEDYNQDRDPITLQGDLGEELDMFRPHGSRSRNKIDHNIHVSRSDSISGKCEYNVESNSVNHYNEKQCNEENSKRYSYLATDPITHSLPETKLVRSQSVRHYKEAWATHDPIGYMHRTGTSYKTDKVRGMKHFPSNKTNTNPITHQQKNISSDQSPIELNDETSTIGDFNEVTIGNVSAVPENRKLRRALRNPITGEGMCDSDYIDLLKLPSEYYFRRNRDTLSSTLNIHPHSPPVQPSSTTTPSTNAAVSVKKVPTQKDANSTSKPTPSKPRHQTPPPPSQPTLTQQPPKLEPKVEKSTPQPIEKKVIRPKKTEMLTEKQPVKENKQPVGSVTQSQPITETQLSTKEAEPQTPKMVAEPQTLETEKQKTPKEVTKPQTPKIEKPEAPKETVKPQTPETEEPQTPKGATNPQKLEAEIPQAPKEVAKPQTLKTEELKTPKEIVIPETSGETAELHTPVETPITPASHTLEESTAETKSAGKPVPQSLSEELELVIGESKSPQPPTSSSNNKIRDGMSEDLHSPAVQSPPTSEANSFVDKMPRLSDAQTLKNDLTPRPSTELPETGEA
ncbi:unnamed protein product [Schistosoma rodhaini]|uniref:Surface protein PspC n=1 Tax=Schistosoma rodhaini TaxID=6188 RepID=A0AA85G1J7_9TREM|nr:unnamed protein product [Schistosoma rodhaini]